MAGGTAMTKTGRQAEKKAAVGNGDRRQPTRDEIWGRMSEASFAVLRAMRNPATARSRVPVN